MDSQNFTTVKKSKWIVEKYTLMWDDEEDVDYVYKCPECRRRYDARENFCPNCGTDMRETDEK